jgi:hypothetical protein
MEVRITITDSGVTTEQLARQPGPSAAAQAPQAGIGEAAAPADLATMISAAAASGAMNAGPAPSSLAAAGMNGPMPFVGGAEEMAGAPGQGAAERGPDQSAGPAAVR